MNPEAEQHKHLSGPQPEPNQADLVPVGTTTPAPAEPSLPVIMQFVVIM
jgi:hypothetical protein